MNKDLIFSNKKFNQLKDSNYFGLGSSYKSKSVNVKPKDAPSSAKYFMNQQYIEKLMKSN